MRPRDAQLQTALATPWGMIRLARDGAEGMRMWTELSGLPLCAWRVSVEKGG